MDCEIRISREFSVEMLTFRACLLQMVATCCQGWYRMEQLHQGLFSYCRYLKPPDMWSCDLNSWDYSSNPDIVYWRVTRALEVTSSATYLLCWLLLLFFTFPDTSSRRTLRATLAITGVLAGCGGAVTWLAVFGYCGSVSLFGVFLAAILQSTAVAIGRKSRDERHVLPCKHS